VNSYPVEFAAVALLPVALNDWSGAVSDCQQSLHWCTSCHCYGEKDELVAASAGQKRALRRTECKPSTGRVSHYCWLAYG